VGRYINKAALCLLFFGLGAWGGYSTGNLRCQEEHLGYYPESAREYIVYDSCKKTAGELKPLTDGSSIAAANHYINYHRMKNAAIK